MAGTRIRTTMITIMTMIMDRYVLDLSAAQPLLKLQSWLSPAFPIGGYSYSHGLEWAVEAGTVRDCSTLTDWLSADLRFGSGRNDAIFFCEAWRRADRGDAAALVELAELAAAYRGTSEFALEAAQQGTACLSTLRKVWPDPLLGYVGQCFAGAANSRHSFHCHRRCLRAAYDRASRRASPFPAELCGEPRNRRRAACPAWTNRWTTSFGGARKYRSYNKPRSADRDT